jgi:amino acid transporter
VVATAFIGAVGAIITAFTNIATVVTFAAFLLVILYGLVSVAALVSRLTQKHLHRPYVMPLWPLPPLLALVGCVLITTQQSPQDIAIVGGLLLLGALYYLFYLRPRSETHWVMLEAAGSSDLPTDAPGSPPPKPLTGQPLVAGSSSD